MVRVGNGWISVHVEDLDRQIPLRVVNSIGIIITVDSDYLLSWNSHRMLPPIQHTSSHTTESWYNLIRDGYRFIGYRPAKI